MYKYIIKIKEYNKYKIYIHQYIYKINSKENFIVKMKNRKDKSKLQKMFVKKFIIYKMIKYIKKKLIFQNNKIHNTTNNLNHRK